MARCHVFGCSWLNVSAGAWKGKRALPNPKLALTLCRISFINVSSVGSRFLSISSNPPYNVVLCDRGKRFAKNQFKPYSYSQIKLIFVRIYFSLFSNFEYIQRTFFPF